MPDPARVVSTLMLRALHADRCLVGLDVSAGPEIAAETLANRFEAKADLAHNRTHRLAADLDVRLAQKGVALAIDRCV